MPRVSNRHRAALSAAVVAVAALLGGCAGFPISDEDIPSASDQELLQQINSDHATGEGRFFYDSSYRPRLIAELARRRSWSDDVSDGVLGRRIWVGMSTEQLVASRGWPRSKTESVGRLGNHATWRYGSPSDTRLSIDVTDGVVTGWTTHSDR